MQLFKLITLLYMPLLLAACISAVGPTGYHQNALAACKQQKNSQTCKASLASGNGFYMGI
ncbi:MAG: hypothetical protein A3E87_00560 [Gammaproteobacteria bacterium RIFCSPHIGHO2_12_FULL_35_23]|nr:MAG: hypothetical protein A3E87_00560 [Gammaproteobacteria bacterium RIFCSPHIGHO2_12_FULL_35_23]